MSQQSIDFYLRQRKETVKRKASTDSNASLTNKVLILDRSDSFNNHVLTPNDHGSTYDSVKLLTSKKDGVYVEKTEGQIGKPKLGKAVVKLSFDNVKPSSHRGHISRLREGSPQIESKNPEGGSAKRTIKFVKRSALSPKKKAVNKNGDITSFLRNNKEKVVENGKSKDNDDKLSQSRKELSLGDIKKCVTRSSRLNELRNSISKLNKGFDRLNQLNEGSVPSEPSSLKGFKSIELIVPVSPAKQSPCKAVGIMEPLMSPRKSSVVTEPLMSPRKGLASPIKSPVKTPAYERYASLVSTTKDSLPLPHHYRWLGELFRSLEQVVSMMFSRKETITFSKVRLAVQEMLRRNFSEKHLKQIKHIVPNLYTFTQEKVKNFGSTAKRDEYELVLKPRLESSAAEVMSPAVILTRQRMFYNNLLNKVKELHKQFLASLDPPMVIPNNELKRWHPEFDLERIADVEEDVLPEPPNVEKFSTAQDVLTHFREKFNCNTKMEKALMKLAEAKKRGLTAEEQKVTGLNADGTEKQISSPMPGVSQINLKPEPSGDAPLNPALKGIPKALLEKVRARQAAKALESMTRTPDQEKDALTYQRLPDIARLLRNLYVTEKKSVLSLEAVVSKMSNSFKIKISNDQLVRHIRLLAKEVKNWLTFYEFNKTEYLRMVKDANLSVIMSHLGDLATKHSLS